MRVPIYISDLEEGHGFTHVAKGVQRAWPGTEPISFADAQHALSRGLGYRDFDDLEQSVHTALLCEPLTDQTAARDGISTALFICWQSRNAEDIDEGRLHHLVMSLPLQELIVFGALPAQVESEEHGKSALARAELRRNDSWRYLSAPREALLFDEDGLRRIWEAMQSKGRLRDLWLFMLLMTGQRASSSRLVRTRDLSRIAKGSLIRLPTARPTHSESVAFLPSRFLDNVTQYKRQANLSEDEPLFPSRPDAGVPVRSSAMNRLVLKYLQATVPNPALRSVYMFRRSAVFSHMKLSQIPPRVFSKQVDYVRYSDLFTAPKK